MRSLKFSVLVILFVFLSVSVVSAQTATGEVNGTVSDPNGAAIPGARLTATQAGSWKRISPDLR